MRDERSRMMGPCAVCGNPTTAGRRGRPALYCSRSCQAKAYRARKSGATQHGAGRTVSSATGAVDPVPETFQPAPGLDGDWSITEEPGDGEGRTLWWQSKHRVGTCARPGARRRMGGPVRRQPEVGP